jgi:ferredoxin
VLEAPEVWSIDEKDGLATLKGSEKKREFFVGQIDEIDVQNTLKAEACCPVCCIKVNQ